MHFSYGISLLNLVVGLLPFFKANIQNGVLIFMLYIDLIVQKTLKVYEIKNKHILGLYEIRRYWVFAYLRGYFFAGLTTTGRSESINAFVMRFTRSHICLSKLIKQYRGSSLRTFSPLEEQEFDTLTLYAFRKFQEEFGRATQYLVSKYDINEYIVQYTWRVTLKSTKLVGMDKKGSVRVNILSFGALFIVTY
ncbi:hypothetical protein V2J09_017456 [Rumex salicifolius]